MLKTFGTTTFGNVAKNTLKQGLYNTKKAHIHIAPPNDVIYVYKDHYKPGFKKEYYKFFDKYTNDIMLKNKNLKFKETIPRTINIGLYNNVEITNKNEKQNYLREKYGYKEHPEEIKDKISKEELERLNDLEYKKMTLENYYINKLHLLINNVNKYPKELLLNYHLNLTEEQILKEYKFAKNSTNFKLQIIKQKLMEFDLVSQKDMKDFESKVNLTETQIDNYTKLLETFDNKQLVNEIIMDELKNIFKNTIINIKNHFKVSKNLVSNLNKKFNEAYGEKILNSKFILFLFNVAKLIKNSKLLKKFLTSLNTYFNNMVMTTKNMQNKINSNLNKIIEYFKNINKKELKAKYLMELLVNPNVNKELVLTNMNELVVLVDKNNANSFNIKIKKFMKYVSTLYKSTKMSVSLLKLKSKNILNQLLIKEFDKTFNNLLKINKFKPKPYKGKGFDGKLLEQKNNEYISLEVIETMKNLY